MACLYLAPSWSGASGAASFKRFKVLLRGAGWSDVISPLDQNTLAVCFFSLSTPLFWAAHVDSTRVHWVIMWTLQPLSSHSLCSSSVPPNRQLQHWGRWRCGQWKQTAIFSSAVHLSCLSLAPPSSSSSPLPPTPKSSFRRLLSSTGRAWQCWRCARRTTSCKQPSRCSLLSATEGRRNETRQPKITFSDSHKRDVMTRRGGGKKKVLFHSEWKISQRAEIADSYRSFRGLWTVFPLFPHCQKAWGLE